MILELLGVVVFISGLCMISSDKDSDTYGISALIFWVSLFLFVGMRLFAGLPH